MLKRRKCTDDFLVSFAVAALTWLLPFANTRNWEKKKSDGVRYQKKRGTSCKCLLHGIYFTLSTKTSNLQLLTY